jgi:hypothetical protein
MNGAELVFLSQPKADACPVVAARKSKHGYWSGLKFVSIEFVSTTLWLNDKHNTVGTTP